MIELNQIMHQKDELNFIELLCRLRKAECTSKDIKTLESRCIQQNSVYPKNALHVYRLNVDERNNLILNSLASEHNQYSIEAMDNVSGHIQLPKLSYTKRSETGGLHGILKIAIGARVMLTSNVDVPDGLVNGAMGMVVEIIRNNDNKVKTIIVEFDNPSIGIKCIQSSPYKSWCAVAHIEI